MSIPYNSDFAEISTFPVGEAPEWVTYEKFVCNLVKERGEESKNLEHMVIGVCGEAGELADGIKRNTIYGKELNRENIVEELGDLEFYMAGLRQMLGISRYETLSYNVVKLQQRYTSGEYSDTAAQERADKAPGTIIIDMSKVPAAAPPSSEAVAGMDEMAGIEGSVADVPVAEWCIPLLAAYHAGKKVQAIGYSANTATVIFIGDTNPYKLYRPKGEV